MEEIILDSLGPTKDVGVCLLVLFFVLFYIQKELSPGLLAKVSKLVGMGRMHLCKFDARFAISLTNMPASGARSRNELDDSTVLHMGGSVQCGNGRRGCDREQGRSKRGTTS